MTIPTFVPPVDPSVGTSDQPEIKTLKADFGDGYTQTGPDGMNNIRSVVSMRWEGLTDTQCNTILGFLQGQRGSDPFLYTLPGGSAVQYTCEQWNRTYNGIGAASVGYNSLTATFRQSFAVVS